MAVPACDSRWRTLASALPDALPYLFEPFSLVSERTIRTHGGSGLGLAICKRLVDIMQGDIGVHSVPGQGSVFWFHLPLQPQAIQA